MNSKEMRDTLLAAVVSSAEVEAARRAAETSQAANLAILETATQLARLTSGTVLRTPTAEVGEQPGSSAKVPTELGDSFITLVRQLQQTEQAQRLNAQALQENTRATLESALSRTAGRVTEAGQAISRLAGGGGLSLLSPLVRGIAGLFRRDEARAEPALSVYSAPLPIRLDAGISEGTGVRQVSYGKDESPRAVSVGSPAAQSVVVQVQAMDSRSFLDHSDDIARAVREALLSNHLIHDAMRDA